MRPESKILVAALGECIHLCNDCHDACLDEKDVMMMTGCIRLDKECAEICLATLALVHRGGHFMADMLALCAKACEACAEECSKHSEDHCRECARACRECAKICRDFLTKVS